MSLFAWHVLPFCQELGKSPEEHRGSWEIVTTDGDLFLFCPRCRSEGDPIPDGELIGLIITAAESLATHPEPEDG